MKNKNLIIFLLAVMLLISTTVQAANLEEYISDYTVEYKPVNLQLTDPDKAERDYQLETISKLLLGYYQGAMKVCEILNMGTIVENPAKVDRSIVVFNNKIYQLVEKEPLDDPNTQRTTALATIHGVDKPIELEKVENINSLGALQAILEGEIAKHNKSQQAFYIVQIKGDFSNLVLQNVPDKNWVEEQINGTGKKYKMRTYKQQKGTIVGIRMFDYLKSNKSIVWYLHFASDDKKISGIVAGARIESASIKISPISDLSIYMPIWKD